VPNFKYTVRITGINVKTEIQDPDIDALSHQNKRVQGTGRANVNRPNIEQENLTVKKVHFWQEIHI